MIRFLKRQSLVCISAFSIISLLAANVVHANPGRLAELLHSPVGSFLLKETTEGTEIAFRVLGRQYAQRDANTLVQALSVSDNALSESGQQLERRLQSIASELESQAGARRINRTLTAAQQRALKELAARKLRFDASNRWGLRFLAESRAGSYTEAREAFTNAQAMAAARRTVFFRDAYSDGLWKGTLESRIARFAAKYPESVKLVENVDFRYLSGSSRRRVLVISRDAVTNPDEFIRDYTNALGRGTVSFPMSEQGGHLYTRFGNQTVDWYGGFSDEAYELGSSKRLETLIALDPVEEAKLIRYVDNVRKNDTRVLGDSDYDGAKSGATRGTITNNKPLTDGEGHNCTSWIATAPIGANGEKLHELVGASAAIEVHTSPKWWPYFLSGAARAERVPVVIYWSDRSLPETLRRVVPGQAFPRWNFGTSH